MPNVDSLSVHHLLVPGGYLGVLYRPDGSEAWRCDHRHRTEGKAKACAASARKLMRLGRVTAIRGSR